VSGRRDPTKPGEQTGDSPRQPHALLQVPTAMSAAVALPVGTSPYAACATRAVTLRKARGYEQVSQLGEIIDYGGAESFGEAFAVE
jgi:hypothetical protein